MLVPNQNIQKTLLDVGFTSTSNKTSKIFADILDKVFLGFGETIQNGLIAEAKKQKLDDFKFPFYSMVQQSVLNFLGETSGKKFIDVINDELTKQTSIKGTIEEILNELSRREIFQQIEDFSGHEHFIYLWTNVKIRDRVFSHFFRDAEGPKNIIFTEEINIPKIKNIKYSEIFKDKNQSIAINRQAIFESSQNNKNQELSKMAGSDNANWFKEGMGKDLLSLEEDAEKYISNNLISAICGYDIKKIPDQTSLKSLLKSHRLILLDDPFVIYERGN
jgi:hypothetical protein